MKLPRRTAQTRRTTQIGFELDAATIENAVRRTLRRSLPADAFVKLAEYVRLLARWNARMNLTSIAPEEWISLHVGECLYSAGSIPNGVTTVLDFGSGAGLPGIPIQIARPELRVTLAECQAKKGAFLREAVRTLDLTHTEIHAGRVEELPSGKCFDLVAVRAVDKMSQALQEAARRIAHRGWALVLTSAAEESGIRAALPNLEWKSPDLVPGTRQRMVLLGRKI